MSMSKKDYIAIAAAIKASARPATSETDASIAELSRRLSSIFAAENPRFDHARFLAACGVQS
jgi:hypothetical protein